MRKNPAAVALGRKGGKARAKLPASELSRIGRTGGRPATYRLTARREVQRLDKAGRWLTLEPPYDEPTKAFLRRQRD